MAKLLESDMFRQRYFEREGPTDKELKKGIEAGEIRGVIICGKPWVADDALFNKAPWAPEKRSVNPLLAQQ